MRAELSQLFVNGREPCSCGWGKESSAKYKLLISKYGQMEMLDVPISDIIKKMENDSCEEKERVLHTESKYNSYWHHAQIHSETFPGKLKTMEKKASICLDCIRSSDAATPCRFQHV